MATLQPDVLAARLGLFTLWVYPQIRGRLTSGGAAKPSSVFTSYPGAISRVLKRDFLLPVPAQRSFENTAKGLLRSYQHVYGTLALATSRRQPLTEPMWQRVLQLAAGTPLRGRAPWLSPPAHDDRTIIRLGCVLRRTAHRLGEIVEYDPSEITYLTRDHVTFIIGGVVYVDPDDSELTRMKPGDIVNLAPCASKPDQFGEDHCSFPSVIEFRGGRGCAAASIRDIFLETPCHGDARRTRPLFATADGRPYSYGTLNRNLHKLLSAVFGEAIASVISWHGVGRIYLAIALREANCPDPVIQLICRWKCAESLQQYAQIGIKRNIEWIRKAQHANVGVVRTTNLQALDRAALELPALDNHAALAELLDDGPRATRAPPAARAPRAAAQPQPQPVGPPLLTAGDRVEVLWGDDWFAGTFTSSRRTTDANGAPVRLHRIYYDATGPWPAEGDWHDLDDTEWRRIQP